MQRLAVVLGLIVLISCQKSKPLVVESGCAHLIDQGHGGNDPGAYRVFAKDTFYEHPYANDISLRLARLVEEQNCINSLTIKGERKIRDYVSSRILRTNMREVLANTDSLATKESWSLGDRIAIAIKFHDANLGKFQTLTSIHVDDLQEAGEGLDTLSGVQIIYAPGAEEYAQALRKSFGEIHALRRVNPVVPNGHPSIGKRILIFHNRLNPIKYKVMIETGNIRSDTDIERLRNPVIREVYARAIAKAIENLAKKHPQK